MADSEDDERRGRVDKFTRERDHGADRGRRDEDRRGGYRGAPGGADYNGAQKRAPPRRDDYPYDAKRTRQGSETEEAAAANAVPVLLPFKKWLVAQDDSINEDDAAARYAEYKLDHKKQMLLKFFAAHKDEEWFRHKYHPDESTKKKDEHKQTVIRRNEIFKDLHAKGFFNDVSLDISNAKKVIFIMDAVVVKLEGGSDEDVELLRSQKVEDDVLVEIGEKDDEKDTEGTDNENGETKKKKIQTHKTQALFLRNVEANIKQSEVEEVCSRFPCFLRLCLSEPVAEKKFSRKGWATYKKDVNIKQIALNINSIRIRETDLHAIINKDLTRKIRTVNGVTAHKDVAQNDLRLAVKVAAVYDHRAGLFSNAPEAERECDIQVGVDLVGQSPNPFIKMARASIVDELSPEEEELMGRGQNGKSEVADKFVLERDDQLLKALDMMIWYLRIVHSVDFYTHGDYTNEDKMPNRCSILHLRAPPPSGSQFETNAEGRSLIAAKFMSDFSATFKGNIEKLTARTYLSEEEIAKLGKKNPEDEVEAFIKANSVELSAEKWLCPLSGKKFKGPEFIRKHLQSKHAEKLEESRQDAFFYNAYLADPGRPVEPEAPPPPQPKEERHEDRSRYDDRSYSRSSYGTERPRYSGGGASRNDYGRRPLASGAGGGGRYYEGASGTTAGDAGGGGARREFRAPISYRDLDAPDEIF